MISARPTIGVSSLVQNGLLDADRQKPFQATVCPGCCPRLLFCVSKD